MYIVNFEKNMYLYMVLRPITKVSYDIEECFHSFDSAFAYLRQYGNKNCLILKVKLKEVIQ